MLKKNVVNFILVKNVLLFSSQGQKKDPGDLNVAVMK